MVHGLDLLRAEDGTGAGLEFDFDVFELDDGGDWGVHRASSLVVARTGLGCVGVGVGIADLMVFGGGAGDHLFAVDERVVTVRVSSMESSTSG